MATLLFLYLRYIGEEHEHFGFVFIYGVGHLVVIVCGEALGGPLFPTPLNPRYAKKMGPPTLGVALVAWLIYHSLCETVSNMFHSNNLPFELSLK